MAYLKNAAAAISLLYYTFHTTRSIFYHCQALEQKSNCVSAWPPRLATERERWESTEPSDVVGHVGKIVIDSLGKLETSYLSSASRRVF